MNSIAFINILFFVFINFNNILYANGFPISSGIWKSDENELFLMDWDLENNVPKSIWYTNSLEFKKVKIFNYLIDYKEVTQYFTLQDPKNVNDSLKSNLVLYSDLKYHFEVFRKDKNVQVFHFYSNNIDFEKINNGRFDIISDCFLGFKWMLTDISYLLDHQSQLLIFDKILDSTTISKAIIWQNSIRFFKKNNRLYISIKNESSEVFLNKKNDFYFMHPITGKAKVFYFQSDKNHASLVIIGKKKIFELNEKLE